MKYFDIYDDVIQKYPAVTMVAAVGKRGSGKTFSMKKFCITNFIDTEKKFIYVRRYEEDIKSGSIGNLFQDIWDKCPEIVSCLKHKYNVDNVDIVYKSHKFFLVTITDNKTILLDYIGRAASVHKAERFKGSPYNDHNIIFYDEMISKGYVNGDKEPELFTKIIDTVFRQENNAGCYILLAGNPDSNVESCPYFRGIPDFDYSRMKDNEVVLYDSSTPTGELIQNNVAFIKISGTEQSYLNIRTGGLFNSAESRMSFTGEVASDAYMRFDLIEDNFTAKYHITMDTAVVLSNGMHRQLHVYYGLVDGITPATVILGHRKLEAPNNLYSRYDELQYRKSKYLTIWRGQIPHTFTNLLLIKNLSEEVKYIFSDNDYNATTYFNIILSTKL